MPNRSTTDSVSDGEWFMNAPTQSGESELAELDPESRPSKTLAAQSGEILCAGKPATRVCTVPIFSGVLSSRFESHPILSSRLSDYSNRLCIKFELDHELPTFSGCPSWAKPLLFQEYQVLATALLLGAS
jgi:hypothetical protein